MYSYIKTETNRELSKLLHAKGCVSESGLYWFNQLRIGESWLIVDAGYHKATTSETKYARFFIPLFTFEDCIRRENAIKIWGDADKHSKLYNPKEDLLNWEWETTELLRSYQRGFDWMNYIINHLKGEHNV